MQPVILQSDPKRNDDTHVSLRMESTCGTQAVLEQVSSI